MKISRLQLNTNHHPKKQEDLKPTPTGQRCWNSLTKILKQPWKKATITDMLKANKKLECLSEEMENLSKETEDIKIINRIFRTEKQKTDINSSLNVFKIRMDGKSPSSCRGLRIWLQRLRWQLWLRSDPQPRNFHMLWMQFKKKKKRQNRISEMEQEKWSNLKNREKINLKNEQSCSCNRMPQLWQHRILNPLC